MRRISIVIAALLALGLAACGGGSSDDTGPETTTSTTVAEATTTTVATRPGATQDVNEDVWYAGFKLSLGSATFSPDLSPVVEIATTFENLGTDSASFRSDLVLTSGGNSVTSTDLTDIPEVPGGMTGKGTIRFDVDPTFDFADAVLTIGASDANQAVVPFGTGRETVTLEPQRVAVSGSATAGQLVIDVSGGELRADIPEHHTEVANGQLALTIEFDATNNGTGGGGYPFVADNLALTLPDGTTVAPDDAPIELLGHKSTKKNLEVRFIVDEPAGGKYELLLREDETTGKLPFSIFGSSGATSTTGTS